MATPHDPTTDLRDQIERYRAWLTETLANADAFLHDHPDDATDTDRGAVFAGFVALSALNTMVPPEDALAASEPTPR